jgi:hypothetical protein
MCSLVRDAEKASPPIDLSDGDRLPGLRQVHGSVRRPFLALWTKSVGTFDYRNAIWHATPARTLT